MKRRPEPELMEGAEQALAYAQADFSESNTLFIKLLAELKPGPLHGARALDLGCGPADIVCRFLRAYPNATCDAVDGSTAMLDQARATLERAPGLAPRCRLLLECLPSPALAPGQYDLVLSNSLLHQLHNPQVLWQTVRETARPGALVLVMDLMRPASAGWAEALVATYTANEPELLRTDFRNSLFAAFEPKEVEDQLQEAGLSELQVGVVSDRHLAVFGRLAAP
ncbi:trans-aconitate 2-methyltransferase [uncultured Lamprocystis sp.]|jgi:SAM-dependent methyltransferase|uniref:class I SAM-dependent methyltransferase n=1 Tax=uncultured Lamprocystis sp. TaxID=543132 RepID=UPI0025D7F3CE|nr:class I SAM-dependent methyltransferase [uncultured Lamprocystis sp.]